MQFKLVSFLILAIIVIVKTQGFPASDNKSYNILTLTENPYELILQTLHDNLKGDNKVCNTFKRYLKDGVTERAANPVIPWPIQMVDSWSKLPSGLLTGNLVDNGQFDECISLQGELDDEKIIGKYCWRAISINISLPAPLALSICVPDSCSFGTFAYHGINITDVTCQTKDANSEFDWEDGIVLGVAGFIFILLLTSTCYETILHYQERKPSHQLLIAFSLLTNGRKLFAVSNSSAQISCLHGIRAISLMWIIAGHRFVSQTAIPQINLIQAIEFKEDLASSYISSGRAAVDTFFFLSAFLVSFNYFKGVQSAISKAEAKGSSYVANPLPLTKIPTFYIHRLLRITPALVAVFFTQITIMRRISSGPIWPFISSMMRTTCTDWWWSLFLYVQNYVNYDNMCIVPSWYLAADMQMYLLCPLLIIPLGHLVIKKKKKLAYISLGVVIILCIITPMIIDFYRKFDILNIYETHARLSVYTLGLLFGMIVIDCKNKRIKLNYVVNMSLWALSLGVMLAIVLTMHSTEIYPEKLKNNLYFTFTRPVWSIALAWIIFACHYGYGGPVNWMLSKSIFQIMTRLSFSMYLLHNLVITASIGTAKIAGHFSEYEVMYSWCGDYIFTIILSIFWVLCFESPIVVIEKVIFSPRSTDKKLEAGAGTENKTDATQA